MKKIKYLLLMLLLIPVSSKAAVYHCSAPSTVESGEAFNVNFYGNLSSPSTTWKGSIVGLGNASYNGGSLSIWSDGPNFSQTVSFVAGDPGTATFYVGDIDVSDEDTDEYYGSDTCYVNIVEATRPNSGGSSYYSYNSDNNEVDPDLSSNSYLKTLSIDGVKINPEFDKDKMEYTAIVSGDTEKINITGELEDDKALVEGLGEKELKEGINTFEIKVTAENTEVRTYVLTVTRKEINPIEITINKKKYIVSKKEIGLEVPKGFTKTKTVIEKQEVVAYSNSFTGYLLVALVDEDGNASWFIYNQKNETYTKYSEYKSDSIRLVLITPKKKDIPYKYKKCDFFINGELVEGYALQLTSPFRLVYALNMATGEENFYLYDMDQNTFQRFYNTQTEIYRDLLKKLEIGIIGLVGLLFIMFIIIISQKVINSKTRKFIKNGGVVEEKKDIQPDEDFEPSDKPKKVKKQKEEKKEIPEEKEEIKDEKVKEKLTKAELKKKRKEEKRKLAEERKEFFD